MAGMGTWDSGKSRRKGACFLSMTSPHVCAHKGLRDSIIRALEKYVGDDVNGPVTGLIVDGGLHYALSPLIYLLVGAMHGLKFVPSWPFGEPSGSAYKPWYPQLFGAAKPAVATPANSCDTSPESDHNCGNCIHLLLDIMKARFSYHAADSDTAAASARQKFVEVLLLGAVTRYYSNQEDMVHILRSVLLPPPGHPHRMAMGEIATIRSPPEQSMAQVLWRLVSPTYVCGTYVKAYWLRVLFPFYGEGLRPDIPLFASILVPSAWGEQELRDTSPDGRLRTPPRTPWNLYHGFDTICQVSRAVHHANGEAGMPPFVHFRAPARSTLEESYDRERLEPETNVRFLHIGTWTASSSPTVARSALIMKLEKWTQAPARKDGKPGSYWIHTGWRNLRGLVAEQTFEGAPCPKYSVVLRVPEIGISHKDRSADQPGVHEAALPTPPTSVIADPPREVYNRFLTRRTQRDV